MATQTQTSGTKPTHRAYSISGEGKSAYWREIGAAWPHRDGKGFTVPCDAIPTNGRIVIRAITKRGRKTEA